MMKKLIVFDFDGTTVDSFADMEVAITHAATTAGALKADDSLTERVRALLRIGKDLHYTFGHLVPANQPERVYACVAVYREYYMENCANFTQPFPGMVELLTDLRAAGCKLAVATTKYQQTIERVAERLGLTAYFDLLQGVDGFPSKPDPHILRLVMQKMGMMPADTLMIGDTDNDILCAQGARVPVCAVNWGHGNDKELASFQPDYLVHTIAELRTVLELPQANAALLT